MRTNILFAGVLILFLAGLAACGPDRRDTLRSRMIGGDPELGKAALYRYGCGACHTISGVAGAHGRVGPHLTGVAQRWYLAGMIPNTPDNMVAWIMNPQRINPDTIMPFLNVPESDARDMVAYLYGSSK
jgi:cytochrome c